MRNLMFVLVLGLMVSMFGCGDIDNYVEYEVFGDSTNVDITYLDKRGQEVTINNATLPWRLSWNQDIDNDTKLHSLSVKATVFDNQSVTVQLIDKEEGGETIRLQNTHEICIEAEEECNKHNYIMAFIFRR